jgi:AraC-like DNA-binding protein
MIEFNKVPESGDPSTHQQTFEKLKINILCCRYWWLEDWQSQEMTFPYWRLYWNKNYGANVFYKQNVELGPDKIIIIPPFTPFSTGIINRTNEKPGVYNLKGGWIRNKDEESEYLKEGKILHFFIHFNLGFPYDNYPTDLYSFDVNPEILNNLNILLNFILNNGSDFSIDASLNIYNLIISVVSKLPGKFWQKKIIDSRIREIIDYIGRNPAIPDENKELAEKVKMAANSFARLFKENIGITPHAYINQIRIDKACDLLHHTNNSLERIAELCGFFDRYHLSKSFKKTMHVSPAEYRKGLFIGE